MARWVLYCVTCSCTHTHTHTVDELSQDGTFAGNDAIVAVSRSCGVNIVIHQLGAPRWEVRAPALTHKTLHIAYLRGEHYCAVQPVYPSLPQVVSGYSWRCLQSQSHPSPLGSTTCGYELVSALCECHCCLSRRQGSKSAQLGSSLEAGRLRCRGSLRPLGVRCG